jgi:HK97 family phage major capsid protein
VRKIATYLRVPEEMIEDIPFLTSFITNIGTEEVLAVEDTQILYGDGTGQNLTGIATSGSFTAFAAGSSVVTSPNKFDVLGASSKQMRVAKRNPSFHLINPADYYDIVSTKDSTNNYILRGGGNGIMPVDSGGVQIVQMNQVAAGDFITVDSRAAQIFFRSNINVRFYEQDQDNAIKNLVTIVIEERLALAIYFTTGIIKGTFAAAITDLTS